MSRVVVILLAFGLDLLAGDPPNHFHPVVLMGRWLTWGRNLAPAHYRFWFGAGWTLAGLALFALPKRIAYCVLRIQNFTQYAIRCLSHKFASSAKIFAGRLSVTIAE